MLQTQTHSHTQHQSAGRAKALSASLGRKMQSYTKHGLRARAPSRLCVCGAVCVYVFVHSAQPHQEWRNGAHAHTKIYTRVPAQGRLAKWYRLIFFVYMLRRHHNRCCMWPALTGFMCGTGPDRLSLCRAKPLSRKGALVVSI